MCAAGGQAGGRRSEKKREKKEGGRQDRQIIIHHHQAAATGGRPPPRVETILASGTTVAMSYSDVIKPVKGMPNCFCFSYVFRLTILTLTDLLNKGYDVETKKLQVKTKTVDGVVRCFLCTYPWPASNLTTGRYL